MMLSGLYLKSKENLASSSSNSNEKSNEPDNDEDRDQLEGAQEEEAGELTINQVF